MILNLYIGAVNVMLDNIRVTHWWSSAIPLMYKAEKCEIAFPNENKEFNQYLSFYT